MFFPIPRLTLTGIADVLGRRHVSVIKPLFWAYVDLKYRSELAPPIERGGVTKARRAPGRTCLVVRHQCRVGTVAPTRGWSIQLVPR